MNSDLSRAGAVLGAAALLVSTLLGTATAAQAAGDGTVVVNVVDQYGRPTTGLVIAYDDTGTTHSDGTAPGPPNVYAPTHTFSVPAGGYSFQSLGPWSGFECVGMSPCSFLTGPPVNFTPVVTVDAGSTATYTFHVTVPSITGGPAIGSTMSVQTSPGYQEMTTLFSFGPFGSNVVSYQWLRGTTDISGATGATYTTGPADSSQAISLRLAPSQAQTFFFSGQGYPVSPFVTNPVAAAKFTPTATKTKVKVPKQVKAGERVSMKVRVTAASGVPDGQVTIKIGRLKKRKTLEAGSLFIALPRLQAGTHKITVTYAGSTGYATSKGKAKVTVNPRSPH